MAHETSTTTHTTTNNNNNNKRKRGNDSDSARATPGFARNPGNTDEGAGDMGYDDTGLSQLIAHNQDPHPNGGNAASATDTAAAALSHQYGMAAEDTSFQSHGSAPDPSFGLSSSGLQDILKEHAAGNPSPSVDSRSKPTVGSEEWHKVRRDNHKEVERRRRETINEGINELQKIVPGCEKNKGSILQRAHQYIAQLKDNEAQNIEKWTLEKLLLDQAINELSASCDRLKSDYQKAWHEREVYKRACEANGIVPEDLKDQEETAAES